MKETNNFTKNQIELLNLQVKIELKRNVNQTLILICINTSLENITFLHVDIGSSE